VNWSEIAPQIFLALVAAAPGIYAIWRGRNKEKADVAKAITEAAGELIEEYKDKLDRLERIVEKQERKLACQDLKIEEQAKKLTAQEAELESARARITALETERGEFLEGFMSVCSQIRELGYDPVWEPKPK
jgi:septal ring factor EnvC (AmiA/AmiB activator)